MDKIPPCTLGARHKWAWSRNRTTTVLTVADHRFTRKQSRRGIYVCACGQQKEGAAKNPL